MTKPTPRQDVLAELRPASAVAGLFADPMPVHNTPDDPPQAAARSASRRRSLWEIDPKLLCPIIGSCVELDQLRRLAIRWLQLPLDVSDFQVHVGSIRACEQRSPLAERLHAALDQRHGLVLQQFRKARSSGELAALWARAVADADVAGALWASCTHPKLDEALVQTIYGDIHMLQHQVGAGQRAEVRALRDLKHEHAVVVRELASAQLRFTRYREERDGQVARLSQALAQAKAQVAGLESALAARAAQPAVAGALQADALVLQRQRQVLVEAQRDALRQQLDRLQDELDDTRSDLARTEAALARLLPQANGPAAADGLRTTAPDPLGDEAGGLRGRNLACVGGRTGSIDLFRRWVEHQGARLLHHDGGLEDAAGRLDAVVAAADAVICQTGCISHGAYWRVKDQCRRTNKPCVFVKTPSLSAFLRGVASLQDGAPDSPAPRRDAVA